MANKESRNILEQQRVDVPDLRAIESGVVYDYKSLLQCLVSNNPFILNGFTIPVQGVNGAATSLQVVVDGAAVWIPADTDGAFLTVPAGTANETLNNNNAKVTGSFAPGQANYLGVRFHRAADPSTADLVSFWDVDAQVEFTKTVPRGLVLNYEFVISTIDFGNTSPIAIITTGLSNNVISLQNAKTGLFRLGRGGTSPDINYSSSLSPSTENSLTATSPSDPDPFAGGDWEISDLKGWMDMVMTQLKSLLGSAYWYANGSSAISSLNLTDLYNDALGTVITGAGKFAHSSVTPGLLTWTSDVYLKSTIGPRYYTLKAGNVTMADTNVLYVQLQRNLNFQSVNNFSFTGSSTTVNASLPISGIIAGDWIKAVSHSDACWRKVTNVSGSTITLATAYPATASSVKALKCIGTYSLTPSAGQGTIALSADVNVPADSSVFWLAKRDDNAFTPLAVSSPGSSGLTRTSDVATATTTSVHGLVAGQSFSISGASDATFNTSSYILTVPSTTTFTFQNPGPNVGSATAGNGTVSAVPKIYLRVNDAELEQGEEVQIDDNTVLNIIRMIGAESEAATTLPYTVYPNVLCSYTFTTNSSLVEAISAITGNVNDIYTTLNLPAYDEPLIVVSGSPANSNQVTGPLSINSTLTLPLNSRRGSIVQYYTVGKGYLQVFLNGQYLNLTSSPITNGWTEIGTPGTSSNTIQFNQALSVDDVVTFRISGPGGPGSGGGGGGGGVTDLNSLTGSVTLAAGTNITLTPSGNTITIASTGGGGGNPLKVEYRTVTSLEASSKTMTLAFTPLTSGETVVDVIGVGPQFYGADFTVSGITLSWSGLGMDSLPIVAGDQIRIMYTH